MAERDDFGSFLVGFIIGGLTGAVVSLLLAPQSGDETRAVIREKAIELQEKATEAANDASERGKEIAQDIQHRGQVILEEQRSRITGSKSQAPMPPAEGEPPAA